MSELHTPKQIRTLRNLKVQIPASPLMKKIGYGTGVAVYELERSPISNQSRSPWAIKKLLTRTTKKNIQLNQRIKEEAEILRTLSHPNVIGFRAFVEAPDGRNVLAMEECINCLGDLIEMREEDALGPFPAKSIVKVSRDLAHALDYLHNTALLLHCDLKSYNVLIKGDFEICKLCDFGVTLPLKQNGDVDEVKAGGEVEFIGTPAWSAPEVLNFPQEITSKVDVYAFGLVIWEMLALAPPISEDLKSFDDASFDESMELLQMRKRPDLPDVDLGEDYNFVIEVYIICTMEDPSKRPNSSDLVKIFHSVQN